MRVVAVLFLLFGVALAGGAIYYAQEHFTMLAQNEQADGPKVAKVLTAKVRLDYGDVIDKEAGNEKLIWRDWPADSIPYGAFTDGKDFLGADFAQTRTVIKTIEPGLPILRSMVSEFGEGVGLRVAPGMRAVTIPINAVTGGGGHISPGDHVDIEWTRRAEGTLKSAILLWNVKVIAVDLSSDPQRKGPRLATTVTVEVTPDDARRLRLALGAGTLSLFLRGDDAGPIKPAEMQETLDLSDLPGAALPEPEPQALPEQEPEPEPQIYQPRLPSGRAVPGATFE